MVNTVAVCGDSFGTGSGLDTDICFEKSFAGITAEHFQLPQRVYARGGCCNFTIFLQLKKVLEHVECDSAFKPIIVITTTHHERIIIPLDDGTQYIRPDLSQIDYISYSPYHPKTGNRPIAFERTKTRLFTQTITNIEHLLKSRPGSRLGHVENLPNQKLDTLGQYYTDIFDTAIKKEYDDSLFIHMHMMLKSKEIPHVIIGHILSSLIEEKNRLDLMWGYYTKKYPDAMGSGHCNEEGNRLVGELLINHIKTHNLI